MPNPACPSANPPGHHPWSSASLFLFISFETLCWAASCLASSLGTLDTGLLEISAKGLGADQPGVSQKNVRRKVRALLEIVPA